MAQIPAGMTLDQVPSIRMHGVLISQRIFLDEVIELPLLAACQRFYDLNIRTVQSSACCDDWRLGEPAFIVLDLDKMSTENQGIARQCCLVDTTGPLAGLIAKLEIPLPESGSVAELSLTALGLANRFQLQSLEWAGKTPDWLKEHAESLEEWFQDPVSGLFYFSQEQVEKEQAFRRGEIYQPT